MNVSTHEKPAYGNWVPMKLILLPGLISLILFGLAILFPALVILAFVFLIISFYFAYARYLFAPQGRDIQDRICEFALFHLDWNGEGLELDIGCGNAALTTKVACKYLNARVIGIDYWGKQWGYSKTTCETNAIIEGVNGRVTFQKASASALPFEDGYFDAVVSNLVFHEVRDAKDKRDVVREALRVVKKGGKFTFQDLFLEKRLYGSMDDFIDAIHRWGIERVEFVQTRNAAFIPGALKLPFMVGTMGILKGEK